MPLARVRVVENVFTDEQKREIIERVTDAMVAVEGESLRPLTWVLVEEVRSGDRGIAGKGVPTGDVRAMQGAVLAGG